MDLPSDAPRPAAGLTTLEIGLIGVGLVGLVLLLLGAYLAYRRLYIPWRKRRRYQQILEQGDRVGSAAQPAPDPPRPSA